MWYINRVSKANPEFITSVHELLQSTSRNLILAASCIYLIWHFVVTLTWSGIFMVNIWFITPIVLLTFVLSLWLLPKNFLMAQAVWQVGLTVAITIAFYIYQRPEIAFLYALLPLMAVVTVGRRGGLLVEGMIITLVWWFSDAQTLGPFPPSYAMGIITGGAFAGVLGWAASHTLLTVTHWSLFNFNQAQTSLEEANQHRGEIVRVMKALDHAYSQLERVNHMLVLARTEAQEAQEARNRFALAVSHELRTPLNFILGFSEVMVNSPDTYADLDCWPPGLYDDVQEIYRSSTHLLRLVNDVLDLGQIEARQMTLFKETVDLAQLIQEAEEMVQPILARKGLWFRSEIEPDLPQVFVDRTRIRQVLLNLVTNSLRFTEQGGVTIRLQKRRDTILVSVEDTGPGIAREDLSNVFKEFQQVGEQGSWRRREGAGLGIPISRRFVQLHGGQMRVESEGIPGRGSQFYFTLPIPDGTAASSPSLSRQTADTRYWQSLKGKTEQERLLMVFSPNPVAGELIGQYTENYKIVALSCPDQVQAKMEELLPNTLIVDQAIINEPEVQSILQNLPYDLPVVNFTFPGSPNRLEDLPDDVSNYLVKPITRQALTEAVQALGPDISNLLVVDDDPAMVRFVTLALAGKTNGKRSKGRTSGNGYQFTTAFTGTEALDRLYQHPPDAVLLDLGLPDISGWEVLARLQKEPELAHLPVIIITANDLPQMFQAGQQETLQVSMNRPFSRRELSTILKCFVETIQPVYPTTLTTSAGRAHPVTVSG
jgi:signal transduction histidine kinase/CheY-like chemotaxis protein